MPAVAAADRLRVAIVPEWYPSSSQPVLGTFVREQARAVASHADVTVIYCDPGLEPPNGRWSFVDERDDGFRVIRIALRRFRSRQMSTIHRVWAIGRTLKEARRAGTGPDLLHAHVFSAGAVALVAGRRYALPVVIAEHHTGLGTGALTAWDLVVAKQVYSRASLTCPVSEDLGRSIRTLAPRARIRQVPNSVDMALFERKPDWEPNRCPRLLTVGLLREIKGTTHLLSALLTVRRSHPTAHLDIVGDGPELSSLRRQAAESGLAEAVTFHGRLAKPDVADLMRSADLFVLPSLWENLPCVVIEALASGLPVVGTRVGGVPELVHADRGILVEPADPEGLANAILEALANPGRWDRAELARAARSAYSLEATGEQWLAVYREVIARSR